MRKRPKEPRQGTRPPFRIAAGRADEAPDHPERSVEVGMSAGADTVRFSHRRLTGATRGVPLLLDHRNGH